MQLDARADVFFRPYHQAITDAIEARQYGTRCTVVISVHCYINAAGLPKDTGSKLVSVISAKAAAATYADLLEEIISLVQEDAQGLDCVTEVE